VVDHRYEGASEHLFLPFLRTRTEEATSGGVSLEEDLVEAGRDVRVGVEDELKAAAEERDVECHEKGFLRSGDGCGLRAA
jgi:hypothetical protein